jgi:hypothetical protein
VSENEWEYTSLAQGAQVSATVDEYGMVHTEIGQFHRAE